MAKSYMPKFMADHKIDLLKEPQIELIRFVLQTDVYAAYIRVGKITIKIEHLLSQIFFIIFRHLTSPKSRRLYQAAARLIRDSKEFQKTLTNP